MLFPLGEYDIRRTDAEGNEYRSEFKVELGRTKVTGGRDTPPIWEDGTVEMPFRDGAHAKFDKRALGDHIPIVAVCGNVFSIKGEEEK